MFRSVAGFLILNILASINLSNASKVFSSAEALVESYVSNKQRGAVTTEPIQPSTPPESESSENLEDDFNQGNLQFTSNFLYNVVKENPGQSVTLSPYSILFLLAELALYATGETYEQLISVLNLKNQQEIKTVIPVMLDEIAEQKNITLNLAERVYGNSNSNFSDAFEEDTKNIFRAEAENIDFINSQTAADIINKWVANNTNNKITNLVPPSVLTPDTKLVLVNALYFLGVWRYKFNSDNTSPQTFYVSENETITVDMMNQVTYFAYVQSDDLDVQVIELPYVNGNLTFLILLPTDTYGATNLLAKLLDPNALTTVRSNLESTRIDLSLPKFNITTRTDLKSILQKLNITAIFDPNSSDLSGILAKPQNLYVTAGIQEAVIEVNESGSEAAAANAIVGVATAGVAMPTTPVPFNADHPFFYYILINGSPIFCGLYAGN